MHAHTHARTHAHTHTDTHIHTHTHTHKRAAEINEIAELDASAAVYPALFNAYFFSYNEYDCHDAHDVDF